MHNVIATFALAAGTLAAVPAVAQTVPPAAPAPSPSMPMRGMGGSGMGGGGSMGMLMRADTNGDGVVTRAEAVAAADARFDQMDVNHDGLLSSDEMAAAMPFMRGGGQTGAPAMPAFQPITRQQFHDRALRPFDRVDANHDGKIDQAEMTAYRDAMRARRQERRDGTTPPPPAAGQQ